MLPERLILALPAPNVRLIGTPRIETPGLVTAHFRSNRVPALLAFLALRPGEEVHREEIADALWPTLSPDAARNNLRVTLLYLRQALETHDLQAGLVVIERSHLSLDERILRIDTVQYEAILRKGRTETLATLEAAASLASAPLLSGLSDDWIVPHREAFDRSRAELRSRYAATLLPIDPERALEIATHLASEDPWSPEPRRLLAEAHLRLGDSASAGREIRAYRTLIQEETGAELPPELAELLSRAGELSPAARGLPRLRTRFYGREAELEAIEEWAAGGDPLLTIYGSGGIGKTRLGAEAAGRIGSTRSVHWIDATGVETGDAVLDRIAAGLGSRDAVPGRALDYIVAKLEDKDALLILDNLEGVADAELPIVAEVLDALPKAQALCISRKTLGLPGERVLRLDPLRVPATPDDLRAPALDLFLDRSHSLDGLRGERIEDDLLALCRELEGIPLAIELAAAKTSALNVRELLDGMQARLDVLVGRSAKNVRHRAMRSTLDWSFDLLDPAMREAIFGLGVLRDGWSVDAANALSDSNDLLTTREVLEVACTNSLLTRDSSGGESRYRMLQVTREYALEALAPSRHARLRARHAAHYGALARRSLSYGELEREEPNLQAALAYLADSPERIEELLSLGDALVLYWIETGAGRPALRTIDRIDRAPIASASRARLSLLQAKIQASISDFEGGLTSISSGLAQAPESAILVGLQSARSRICRVLGRLDEAETAARAAIAAAEGESPKTIAEALLALANVQVLRLDSEGFDTARRALAFTEAAGDTFLLGRALDTLGFLHFRRGEFDLAEAALARSEALPLEPTSSRQANRWIYRGQIAVNRRDQAAALAAYETALALSRACAHPWFLCQSLAQLGDTYTRLDRFSEARAAHAEAYEIRLRTGERAGLASCLRGLGMASHGLGEYERAFEELSESRRIGKETSDDFFLCTVLMPLAAAARAAGRVDYAVSTLQEVIELGDRLARTSDLAREIDLQALVAEARATLDDIDH